MRNLFYPTCCISLPFPNMASPAKLFDCLAAPSNCVTATAVAHVIAPTRGKIVPTEFLNGARPKVWISDRLLAQCNHAEAHQFCLSHLIRDAQYAIDAGDTVFAPEFKAFLQRACDIGSRRPNLADATIKAYARTLARELDRLLKLKPTNAEGRHLRDAIIVDAQDKLLVFMTRRDVEPTNNVSERILRPSVIFRKITNCFRSDWGAKAYADLCSIVGTGRLNGRSPLADHPRRSHDALQARHLLIIGWRKGVSNYRLSECWNRSNGQECRKNNETN
jgi:Transposase IS66 family